MMAATIAAAAYPLLAGLGTMVILLAGEERRERRAAQAAERAREAGR